MPSGERTGTEKVIDAIANGSPFGFATSDKGLELKYLDQMNKQLERHHSTVERSLTEAARKTSAVAHRVPEYLPSPSIHIDTSGLATATQEVADKLSDVIETQETLVNVAQGHTPLFHRMIQNQGMSAELQYETLKHVASGNQANMEIAYGAFQQRNTQIEQLSEIISGNSDIVRYVAGVSQTVATEAWETRNLLQELFTDLGSSVADLTQEQVITRIGILQGLYSIRSTFLQTHAETMLTLQQQKGLLEQILQAVRMTNNQKESRHLWEQSERIRRKATTAEDFTAALKMLKEAHTLDTTNASVYISIGTIQSTLGNPILAATAFAEADDTVDQEPYLTSYILMNLAGTLMTLQKYDHAERAMRKATKVDPLNREAWFLYAKTAWLSGKEQQAIQVLKTLIMLNGPYYRAQIAVDPVLFQFSSQFYE